jgi:CDP-6-deoxy-D-xylo-4-hexulose-3-dehydrase
MSYRVPLAYNTFADEERDVVTAIMESGRMTQGPEVERFEKEFAKLNGAKYAIMVNSGSSANLIGIEAVYYCSVLKPAITHGQLKPGDEIIVPGLSWPTTLTPILNHGLQAVFCDVSPSTMNLTVETVEAVRTPATRAVVAVPVMGNPEGLEELKAYCERERLILIEDACESLGARSQSGKLAGTFGLVSAFSFYFSHHMSTIEGGAILTDCREIADLCYILRSHGWSRDMKLDSFSFDEPSSDKIDPRFCFLLPGYNVRPTEINAAVGGIQLGKLTSMLARRRQIARDRIKALGSSSNRITVPGSDIQDRHSWMTFPLIFSSKSAKQAAQALLEERGIETRPIIAGNILRHPLAKSIGLKNDQPDLPVCDEIFARGLMIGLSPFSDPQAEAYVHEALQAAAQLN